MKNEELKMCDICGFYYCPKGCIKRQPETPSGDMPDEIWVDDDLDVKLKGHGIDTKYIRADLANAPAQDVDVDYLNKQIEFHYYTMTHSSHSEIVKQQSENAYHALCDIKHNLRTPKPTTDEKRVMDLMSEALDTIKLRIDDYYSGKQTGIDKENYETAKEALTLYLNWEGRSDG